MRKIKILIFLLIYSNIIYAQNLRINIFEKVYYYFINAEIYRSINKLEKNKNFNTFQKTNIKLNEMYADSNKLNKYLKKCPITFCLLNALLSDYMRDKKLSIIYHNINNVLFENRNYTKRDIFYISLIENKNKNKLLKLDSIPWVNYLKNGANKFPIPFSNYDTVQIKEMLDSVNNNNQIIDKRKIKIDSLVNIEVEKIKSVCNKINFDSSKTVLNMVFLYKKFNFNEFYIFLNQSTSNKFYQNLFKNYQTKDTVRLTYCIDVHCNIKTFADSLNSIIENKINNLDIKYSNSVFDYSIKFKDNNSQQKEVFVYFRLKTTNLFCTYYYDLIKCYKAKEKCEQVIQEYEKNLIEAKLSQELINEINKIYKTYLKKNKK